jgi:hypothetical protein
MRRTVDPNICGSSVWNLVHVTLLASQNFGVAPRLLENLWVTDNFILIFMKTDSTKQLKSSGEFDNSELNKEVLNIFQNLWCSAG